MKVQDEIGHKLSEPDQLAITAGDYVETTLGLIYGLSFGAGILVASPASPVLLGGAFAVGGGMLLWELL